MDDLIRESKIDIQGFLSSAEKFLDGQKNDSFKFYDNDVVSEKVERFISEKVTALPDFEFEDYINIIKDLDCHKFLNSFIDHDVNVNAKYNENDSLEIKIAKAFRLYFDVNKKSVFNDLIDNYFGDGISDLAKVAEILNILGLKRSTQTLLALLAKSTVAEIRKPVGDELIKRLAISERNRVAGKGNVNKNRELVMSIAKKTWEQYPNASLGGLRDEIYEHLTRNNITSRPSMATINDWLKKAVFRPNSQKTNRDFVLVID